MTHSFQTMAEVRAFNMGVDLMLRIVESTSAQVLLVEPRIACADPVSYALEKVALEARKALIVPGVDGWKPG